MNKESYATADKETSSVAKTALYCLLSSFLIGFLGLLLSHLALGGILIGLSMVILILSFLLAILALFVITIRHRQVKGYGLVFLVLVLGGPFCLLITGMTIQTWMRFERAKENTGEYNLTLLGDSLIKYAENNNGYLPDANSWCDLLIRQNKKLTTSNFVHPQPSWYGLTGACHFAFNRNLSKMRLADILGDTVLLIEADGDWNLSGTSEILSTRGNDPEKYISVFFVNGKTAQYWFYENAVRKFNKSGMYYEEPRWNP